MVQTQVSHKLTVRDVALAGLLVAGLGLVYVFQEMNYFGLILGRFVEESHPNIPFAFNRTFRLLINDTLCMGLIYVLFRDRKFIRIGFMVFLLELLVILPLYLAIKLSWEGPTEISSPLLSPVHRMVVNPLLMMVLIIGFWLQRRAHT
ncbi:MAG: exosortase F system-associated protein [Bacteroidetes bacterium]|nr:exosortase F system-associated protein [Bacteroidota bacterium]